jgi:hypothetical protein
MTDSHLEELFKYQTGLFMTLYSLLSVKGVVTSSEAADALTRVARAHSGAVSGKLLELLAEALTAPPGAGDAVVPDLRVILGGRPPS